MKSIHYFPRSLALALSLCSVTLPQALAQVSPVSVKSSVKEISVQEADAAAAALIERVIPLHASYFKVDTSLPKVDGNDAFTLSDTADGKILLHGNNGVSVASALHWYLKHRVNCHLSWCGDQLDLPNELPKVGKTVKVTTLHEHRVYFNYCTLNYTCSWWDWERWQREVDFMAMNGINMPLGVVGLEGVWYETLLEFGFTDLEAREFLVGPTHFAWQWMTNIQGKGEALPKEWIDKRLALGRKLLDRQRALGMTPIQQGFTGFVPRLLKEKFPDANIVREGGWCGFEGTAQLDPLDPLFRKFGKAFLQNEIKLLGTSHVYAADPFHEGHPPKPGKEYLKKVGSEIFKLIDEVDPKATIAMQAWTIRKEICEAFPKDRLVVLDLAGGRSSGDGFWGYKFVKGQLHNFGGRINMHGDLSYVASNPFAHTAKAKPLCAGLGLFPESIEQNPVFYNMVFDMVWRTEAVDPEAWLASYARRRYGKESANAVAAWKLLLAGPYARGTNGVERSSIIAARPALIAKKSGPNAGFQITYDPQSLVLALELLLKDSEQLKHSEGYQFDVADVTRQVLSNLGQELHRDVELAFHRKDKVAFKKATGRFLKMLADVDQLLAPLPTHHFGKWVSDARSFSKDKATQDYYERQASMLLTTWGPVDKPLIFDYAWREWSGLIKHYYAPRWKMFYSMLEERLENGQGYEDPTRQTHGRESLRANEFYQTLADWEIAWTKAPHQLEGVSSENPVTIAERLMQGYQPIIEEIYGDARMLKIEAMQLEKQQAKYEKQASEMGVPFAVWHPRKVSGQWQELTSDVTKLLSSDGTYEVSFVYTGGRRRLDIAAVELLKNGEVIVRDEHLGFAGKPSKDNTFTLPLKDYAFNTRYQVRMKVRGLGGEDTKGTVFLRKK